MSFFSAKGVRRRTLLLIAGLAVLVAIAIALTGAMWAAGLTSLPTMEAKTSELGNQAPSVADTEEPQTGKPDQQNGGKAWLGIYLADVDGGVKVLQVLPDSPAARAEVKKDDIITAVNNTKVTSAKDVTSEVQKNKPGDKVLLSINRGNEQRQIEVIAGTLKAVQRSVQPFAFRRLPPELKGLEGLPLREMFNHFVSGTFKMKDKDGQEVVINLIPGTVTAATSTSISIAPNDGGTVRQFDVSENTVLVGSDPRSKVENLKVDSKVLVVTVGNSNHASMVARVGSAYNPMGDLMPGLKGPRLWQMPDMQQFRNNLEQRLKKPLPQPNM